MIFIKNMVCKISMHTNAVTTAEKMNIQGSDFLGQQVDVIVKDVHKISDTNGREEGSISIDERTRFTNLVLF